jgi:hypothetical protein
MKLLLLASVLLAATLARASGHGPVFGLATPTNPQGGWSLDVGTMARIGRGDSGAMMRTMLGYGVTQDFKLAVSLPVMLEHAQLAPARAGAFMSVSSDFELLSGWRFHRKGTDVGTRVESTGYAALLVPGPQLGPMGLARAPGLFVGAATGVASRSHYLWGGLGRTQYAASRGDQRAAVLMYSAVWGYRPPALRKDYPHWDWRLFVEMTGEEAGQITRNNMLLPATGGHQIFVGPTTLGIWKNYAISGGVQFPVYRDTGPAHPRERLRLAVNFSYFF